MAQRVGAFRVFGVAHQTIGPFVHLSHRGAFGVQRIREAVERFELMIISRLELQVLTGVILRGFYRLREDLQRQGIGIVRQPRELHLLLGVLLQPNRHRRPAVHRLQARVHVVDIVDVLR